MGTLRDDLVNAGRKLLETVEDRTGREVVRREELQLLESERDERRRLQRTLDYIGYSLWNYEPGTAGLPGHPGGNELRPNMRRFIAQQARTAWVEDPMLGNHIELYLSFVFGRGVPRPQAHDPEVQKHLDAAWDDAANQRVLTSYQALIEKGVDLCHQSNVYFKFFDDGQDGMVRVSLECFDDVEDVVRHSELAADGRGDRFRILYYRSRERRVKFSFEHGSRDPISSGDADPAGTARTVYYEAWGAFDDDDPVMAAQDEGLRRPPQRMLRPGKIVHLAVNKTSEMAFGVPRMQRYVNWATAYNEMLVSFRDRMKAMASVYMTATVKGGQRDLNRLAQLATGRTSTLGGSRDLAPEGQATPPPRGPGILGQNESLRYDPMKIDSTAGDVAQAAPVIRGQLGGPWPDSYLSGFAEGAIAGAQCHDDQTETLTDEGWLTLAELKERAARGALPRVAAFDVDRQVLRYERPISGLRVFDFDGELIAFRNRRVDVLVTPNHRMLVQAVGHDGTVGPYEFREAAEITSGQRLRARVSAPLEDRPRVETFTLPAYAAAGRRHGAARGEYAPAAALREQIRRALAEFPEPGPGECGCGCGQPTAAATRNHPERGVRKGEPMPRIRHHIHNGGRTRRIAEQLGCSTQTVLAVARGAGYDPKATVTHPVMRPPVTIPMEAWLRWLGWYLAEGADGGVAQSEDSPWLPQIKAACAALGVPGREAWKMGRGGKRIWTWTPRNEAQWIAWLDEHVGRGAENKRVPGMVWELPAEQQMELLRGFMGGDGNGDVLGEWERGGCSTLATISGRLADDLQRLATHCGFRARKITLPSYMTRKGLRTPYVVSLLTGESSHTIRDHVQVPKPQRRRYRGEVYCFTMPSGTLVTRRNGYIAIHGNSLELPTLKFVEREQELWVQGVLRPFAEANVRAAVEAGDISEWREPTQAETEQIMRAEAAGEPLPYEIDPQSGLIKRDLSFDIALPNPLKRAMLDIVSAAQQTAMMIDPNGENLEASRWAFATVLAEAFDVQDPMRIVDEVLPRQSEPTPAELEANGIDPATGQPLPESGAVGPDGQRHSADNPAGAPVNAPQPEDRKVSEAAIAAAATALLGSVSANGNGTGA